MMIINRESKEHGYRFAGIDQDREVSAAGGRNQNGISRESIANGRKYEKFFITDIADSADSVIVNISDIRVISGGKLHNMRSQ